MLTDPFAYNKYRLERQFWRILGASFRIYSPDNSLTFFVDQRLALREDIHVYADESKAVELLSIQARRILDFSAAYDVWDVRSGQKVGAFKRKGWSSLIRDSWIIMDMNDNEVGTILEDSQLLALVRRFLTELVPQKFHGTVLNSEVFHLSQHFNPFLFKMDLDYSMDATNVMDRRMGIAAAVLIAAIEGRQRSE